MRTPRFRWTWIALLAVLLAGGPVGLGRAAAQADGTPTADEAPAGGSVAAYRAQTRLEPSVFGPERGSLEHNAETIAFAPAGVNLYNFFATVRVTAPYDGTGDQLWDAGFAFRAGRDADWRVVVYSNGTWDARIGNGDPLASGEIDGFKAGEGDTDTIELAVDGDTAYLAVNREEVGSFDIARRSVPGDVIFGVAFTDSAFVVGETTPYSRFQVWKLPDDGGTAAVSDGAVALLEQGRDVADTDEPVGGPVSGTIDESADSVTIDTLGVSESDFYARIDVTNPRGNSDHPFDIGFGFRDTGGDAQYRLIIASDGTWYVKYGLDPAIAAGRFDGFEDGPTGTNRIEVVASGDLLVFANNGRPVGAAPLADHDDAGDLAFGVGFYPDEDVVEGDTTAYADFTAWSLGANNAPAEPTRRARTPTPTDGEQVTPEPTEAEATAEATEAAPPEPTEEAATTPAPGDPEDAFAAYLEQEPDLEILYGPKSGELEHQADAIAYANADLDVTDFIAHVEFTNPYAASTGDWDYGFLFRVGQDEPHLRLIVDSSGAWYLTPSADDPIQQGELDNLNTGRGQTNTIDLVVIGDTGYFGVNGEFVAELDLSSVAQSGDIAIATSFFENSFRAGASTGYDDFVIWAVPENAAPGQPTAEPTSRPGRATAEPTTRPGRTPTAAAGNGYESPTYGYTVTYDEDVWSVVDESSEDGVDYLRLTDDVSTVDFTGYQSDFTPEECRDDEFAYYQGADGYTNVDQATDADDNEMSGTLDDGTAWGVYWFTYTPEDGGPTDYTAYVECRTLEEGVSILKIVQFVPFDDYNDEIQARVDLLAGLSLKGTDGQPAPRATRTPAGDEETPEATGTAEPSLAAVIDPVGTSDVQGIAAVTEQGRQLDVVVLAFTAPDGTKAVIQQGTCDDLPGEAAFELEPVENGLSETLIDATLEDLQGETYAITLHEATGALDDPIACGELIG